MSDPIALADFQKVELRVARVLEAWLHPNAERLLVLKVKVGEAEKQIVAGIRAHYQPEQLVGRQIVVVNNLQPALLRGEESQGMLLAASDGARTVILVPDGEIADGATIR